MNPETNVSRVELEAPDADVAMWSYSVVGYRVVGLERDGAFVPEQDTEGRLVLDACGALAIQQCLAESISYNEEHVKAKIEQRLSDRKVILPESHLNNLLQWLDETSLKLTNMIRVHDLIAEKLTNKSEEDAA